MKTGFYFIFLIGLFFLGTIQAQDIDSLRGEISKMKADSNAVIYLDKLSHQYANSNIDAALICSQAAFDKSRYVLSERLSIIAERNLGIIYTRKANYIQAISHLINAVKKADKNKYIELSALCYNAIGNCYALQRQGLAALNFYKKTLQLFSRLGNTKRVAAVLGNIGNIAYQKTEDEKIYLDTALFYYLQALHYNEINNDTNALISILNRISIVQADLFHFRAAKQYLARVKELLNKKPNTDDLLDYYNCVGRVLSYEKENKKALLYYDSCLTIAQEIGDIIRVSDTYLSISDIGYETGDYQMAYEYFIKHKKIKDSIVNTENFAQASDFQNKYEREKKEQENKLLQQENKQQKLVSYFIVGGLVLALLFSFFIFRGLKAQREANQIISKQKEEVYRQKHLVEEKNKEITDSITYAKRIQNAILPNPKKWQTLLPHSFVLYQPKDIVAGDFYWLEETHNYIYLAAADCTGHGVPGAMVSVVCSSALSKAVLEEKQTETHAILDATRRLVLEQLGKSEEKIRDGMDICLIRINKNNRKHIQYSGANRPLYISNAQGELQELKPDKQPIGQYENEKPFSQQELTLAENDTLYLLTDGYADQFGGDNNKKFSSKALKKLMTENAHKGIEEQRLIFTQSFLSWRSNIEQTDDVTLIGLRM
ncbi:MAG: SpoIIE family protein phosphatase [Bacteroidetes bacterium]|nr:SpoIIE family protein phosphatase [Bacteroidota bacterium]